MKQLCRFPSGEEAMRQGGHAREFANGWDRAMAIGWSGHLRSRESELRRATPAKGEERGGRPVQNDCKTCHIQSSTSPPSDFVNDDADEEERESEMELEILGMNFGCVLGALQEWEFPEKNCVLPLVSKLLGYCIVAASTTVKLPQILKILKHNSVRGLSLVAFELEVVGYTIALAYCVHKELPFSAYGELLFLLIQAIILVAIIYYYSQPLGGKTWIKPLLYCAIAPTIIAGQIDPFLFEALYASQHFIFFSARVPQIWTNYKNKSTGELSFLTCFMNFAGSIVRVFTSIQENAPVSGILMTFYDYGFNHRHHDERHHIKPDSFIPKTGSEKGEERELDQQASSAGMSMLFVTRSHSSGATKMLVGLPKPRNHGENSPCQLLL
ncbi:hypothetical protein ZIOFF_047017 [Zingiber officinale]|uniref:Mannose-P-dolichol utilization defect 1 protein homolog n=1 Tax=Zingiber officinale TaxID=94328 RepID=A0A8J5FU89_ZINOF|nr:hypothetical protein ZIOFF_047017 [Zingiber officinale]